MSAGKNTRGIIFPTTPPVSASDHTTINAKVAKYTYMPARLPEAIKRPLKAIPTPTTRK